MISNVTDFKLDSVNKFTGYTTYTFSFIKPVAFVGGYLLQYSFNKSQFSFGVFRPDTNLKYYGRELTQEFTQDVNGRTILTYTQQDTDAIPGSYIYFRISCISQYQEYSYSIPDLVYYTTPSLPSYAVNELYLKASYQYSKVELTFLDLDYSGSNNKDVSKIRVEKEILTEASISDFSEYTIISKDIAVGDRLVVHDFVKQSIWYGVATEDYKLYLSGKLLQDYSHVYTLDQPPFQYNLKLYKIGSKSITISELTPTKISGSTLSVTDQQIAKNSMVLYTVKYITDSSEVYSSIATPLLTSDVQSIIPMWRTLEKSNTPLLKNITWKKIKNTLVDKNYYDKSYWTLPYSETEKYSLVGYCGVGNCYVDIFINGTLYTTVISNEFGEFEFLYKYTKTSTDLTVQVRTLDNLYFSGTSSKLTIRTNYAYTFFGVMAGEYSLIRNEQSINRNKISIDTCDTTSFQDIFASMAGFSRYATESTSIYKAFVKGAYKIYNNIAYEQGLFDLLDLMSSNVAEIDGIKFLPNAQFEETQISGDTFILCDYNTLNLERAKYRYYITAVEQMADGLVQETSPYIYDCDCRWWPTQYYRGYVVLEWDRVPFATSYRVYRNKYNSDGSLDEETIAKLIEVTHPFIVDTGTETLSEPVKNILYNSTTISSPSVLRDYSYLTVNSYENLLKKPYYFNILINMVGDNVLPDYLIQRFIYILKNITPAEMFYHVIVSNNSTVAVYNKRGIKVN